MYVLFESASGYAAFEVEGGVARDGGPGEFVNRCKLVAFQAFTAADTALQQAERVADGECTEELFAFLSILLPAATKRKVGDVVLGVTDTRAGNAITEATGIRCVSGEEVHEAVRGIRANLGRFVKELGGKGGAGGAGSALGKAQLGLAHAYSRRRVAFNVNRVDNMIIQAISLLDLLDKDVNTFAMRVREWYSWHFPELGKLVGDNLVYADVVRGVGARQGFVDKARDTLVDATGDEAVADEILGAAKVSMGQDLSEADVDNITRFAARVADLMRYRQKLVSYLGHKLAVVAPNLTALVGDIIAARLISQAGSLGALAKYPASTVQILGAEKALFRALKTKSNTPKYGILFNSSFIGRAHAKHKGRMSRYLANKCSIAGRIDMYSESYESAAFGLKLKEQVEERLRFYDEGGSLRKNIDVIEEAASLARKAQKASRDEGEGAAEAAAAERPAKKSKKDTPKKEKKKSEKKKSKS